MPVSAARLTPVQRVGDIWLKRDDLWRGAAPAQGGKARTAAAIARRARAEGRREVLSTHDRNSSVPGMLARVMTHWGLALRLWLPAAAGPLPAPFAEARAAGAALEEVRPGYMSVRRRRMRDYEAASGDAAVALGPGLAWGACGAAETAAQCANVAVLFRAGEVRRVVVPVGSGVMLDAIVRGLAGVPVLGVACGAAPRRPYPPSVRLAPARVPFGREVCATIGGVSLDPVYEAKCIEFLQPGDLLWIVANRETE